MDIQTAGQTSQASGSKSASLESLLSGIKVAVKVEAVDKQNLTVNINNQQLKVPIEHLDAKTQESLKQLVGSQTDTQQLQKLLAANIKIPVEVKEVTQQAVTLQINQQNLVIPTKQLDAALLSALRAIANSSQTQALLGDIQKVAGDLVIKLLQPTQSNQPLQQAITQQQLLQLLPTPATRPIITTTLLQQANTLVEFLAKVTGSQNGAELSIGTLKIDLKEAQQKQLASADNPIRTQLKQAANNVFLQLTADKSSQQSFVPITDKKLLFQLTQFALANNKTVKLQTAIEAGNSDIKLNQLKLPFSQSKLLLTGSGQTVEVKGTAAAPLIQTNLTLAQKLSNVGSIKLSSEFLPQLFSAVAKTASANKAEALPNLFDKTAFSSAEKTAVQNALRQLIPLQQSHAQLIKLLQATGISAEQELRPLLKTLGDKLLTEIPSQQKGADSATVQQILQPFVTPQPVSLQQPQAATNMQSGLEGLLQLLLTARVSAKTELDLPNNLQQRLLQFIANPAAIPQSMAQSLRQLGQNNLSSQLLAQLAGVFASQKLSQVSFAESVQQNNPQYFLNFPVNYSGQARDIEILIKPYPEKDPHENDSQQHAKGSWQVNLRFDIPSLGVVLANANINGKKLALDFYAESSTLLNQINKYSGILQNRLSAAGLEIEKVTAQQGKIPETLQQKQHSLLYVRA